MAYKEEVLRIREGKRQALLEEGNEKYMRQALKLAQKAFDLGEVPIGCVIVQNGKVIGRGYNRRNTDKTVLAHAEITAIKKACKKINDFRLEDCIMYVTLEPCPMCAGAIVQARIPKLIYGCKNDKAGSAGTVINILDTSGFNHSVEIRGGMLDSECSDILKDFFRKLRAKIR